MENKINKMIQKNKIQQTNINNGIYLINYYKKNKKYGKKIRLENKILRFLLTNYINNNNNNNNKLNKITKNFIKQI